MADFWTNKKGKGAKIKIYKVLILNKQTKEKEQKLISENFCLEVLLEFENQHKILRLSERFGPDRQNRIEIKKSGRVFPFPEC